MSQIDNLSKADIEEALLALRGSPVAYSTGNPLSIPCNETSDLKVLCQKPLVSVCMITYNQEAYIRQAIEGVLMQRTDFEFELVIGEDCSTDRTREICFEYQKKHPDKVRVLWSDSNLYRNPHPAGGNCVRTRTHCRGEYIALCEGDDWWTDPLKLQKQIDVFRSNPECSIVYTDFLVYYQKEDKYIGPKLQSVGFFDHVSTFTLKDYLTEQFPDIGTFGFFATASLMYKKDLMDAAASQDPLAPMNLSLGDYQLRTRAALCGKVGFVKDPCAVYRIGTGVLATAHHQGNIKMTVDIIYVRLIRIWDMLTHDEREAFLLKALDDVLRVERCKWPVKIRMLKFYAFVLGHVGIRALRLSPKILIVLGIVPQSVMDMKRRRQHGR